ncbi:MAG TPA: flagellar biosynthetic protein FliR [Steroidobacteraceae bacterium]|nr:flagellar biosynthetic protein FliR [Steroidobacteraceae bacterium]HRX89323.1 flagellar biosynthetic protein FliR [Steroidobacteraceae bacterium]
MLQIQMGQLEGWLAQGFWPFVRIGACFMVAPVFAARYVPARVRIALALAVTLLVAPLVSVPDVPPFSAAGVAVTAQQLLIGLSLGFALQLVFDALTLGGQVLANSMGLSFALNQDPLRGSGTPAIGQFYTILVTMTFLALGGHLALIEILAQGFQSLPLGGTGLGRDSLWSLVLWGGTLFAGAVTIALPGVTALLIVNLSFGVMSRAAPSFNLFAVGFPVSLVLGLVILLVGLPTMQDSFIELLGRALAYLRELSQLSGS